jgi:3-isopropylmalate/(R)-2-methylmalate dehydratase small subunit
MFKGHAHVVGDNIDTDAIIPARFLVSADALELGRNCMEGISPGWNKRLKKGDIMIGGKNFGCGSSREHAPLALLGAGVPVVAAHSFARIFYRNAFNMGLVLMEIGDDIDKFTDGDLLEVDPQAGVIRNLTTGQTVKTAPVPSFMQKILDAGGLVNYVKDRLQAEA